MAHSVKPVRTARYCALRFLSYRLSVFLSGPDPERSIDGRYENLSVPWFACLIHLDDGFDNARHHVVRDHDREQALGHEERDLRQRMVERVGRRRGLELYRRTITVRHFRVHLRAHGAPLPAPAVDALDRERRIAEAIEYFFCFRELVPAYDGGYFFHEYAPFHRRDAEPQRRLKISQDAGLYISLIPPRLSVLRG